MTASGIATENTVEMDTSSSTKARRLLKKTGWVLLALFLLIFFTVMKLPEDRVKNYVQGSISSALSGHGVGFTAGQSWVSIILGLSYTMKDVTLTLPPPHPSVKIDRISASPSFLSLLTGALGGNLSVNHGEGKLGLGFSTRKTSTSFSFTAKSIDLGKLGILPMAAGLQGTGIVSGSGWLKGDFSVPNTLNGEIHVDLSKFVLSQQMIQGFSIPQINVSEGKLDVVIEKGKALVKTLKLGKIGDSSDDIHAHFTGDIQLEKQFDNSKLNLKSEFSLSEKITKSISLLDLLLGAGKQPNGSYAFLFTGQINGVRPEPIPPTAGSK